LAVKGEKPVQTKEIGFWKTIAGAALCGALWTGAAVAQDNTGGASGDVTNGATGDVTTGETGAVPGTVRVPDIPATKKTGQPKHSPTTNMYTRPPAGSDERADMTQQNGRMLMETLSEEKTEMQQLAAQAAAFRKMGGRENIRIANMLTRWVREHKAASPTLMNLARRYGGNPERATILKPPVLGSKSQMLHATMMDHMKAEKTSQMRWKMSNSAAVKMAMRKRANLSRKHMREMKRYHSEKNCPMCAEMMSNKGGHGGNDQRGQMGGMQSG
jgi:hypothetical protein